MVTRREGREWALQLLVQFDLNPPDSVDAAIEQFWLQQDDVEHERIADGERVKQIFSSTRERDRASLADIRAFAEERVRGVSKQTARLDAALEPFLQNWSMYRLGTIERNVLRLGAWEILCSDVPPPIVVNEAVDLAKFFSASEAGRFVNGVLDKFAKRRPTEKFAP